MPQFLRTQSTLIQAMLPFQRINIDLKGPLPKSANGNQYLLTVIDEFPQSHLLTLDEISLVNL